jgi:hypothetical protein
MEVHHHPHVEKKSFKEYFLEFVMIFLAVTMGFFAESLREHINDNQKREQYIQSLVEDLETDTARMEDIILFDEGKINAIKSMYACYDTVTKNMKATSCMGILIKYSKVNRSFQPNDRTYIQLANANWPMQEASGCCGKKMQIVFFLMKHCTIIIMIFNRRFARRLRTMFEIH